MWYSTLILHLTLAFHTGANLCPTCSSFEPTQLWPLGPFGEWTNGWNAALSISPSCCSSGFQVKQIIKKKSPLLVSKGPYGNQYCGAGIKLPPVVWAFHVSTGSYPGCSIFIQFPGKGSRKCSKYLGPCHAAE